VTKYVHGADEALTTLVDAARRLGAKEVEVGYDSPPGDEQDDNPPAGVTLRWYAKATLRTRVDMPEQISIIETECVTDDPRRGLIEALADLVRQLGGKVAIHEHEREADFPELPTTERLARALEAAKDSRLDMLIARARQGYYDYRSPIATPCVQLVTDLRAAGHPELAERAKGGEWDATKAESDAWAQSPEGQATFRELFGGR
jgi:hypothetical protein